MNLAIIEGFYGTPWSWESREAYISFLIQNGFSTYYYAPKADSYFRRKWKEPLPEEHKIKLTKFSKELRRQGLEFGIGFTPFEIHFDFSSEARAQLVRSLSGLLEVGVDRLALLFDDMKGGQNDLAERQAEIVNFVQEFIGKNASRKVGLAFCPTYYSDASILDELFGRRPEGYLEELGKRLNSEIEIIWTGPKICSEKYPPEHLHAISERVQRKLFLWDNYPVNDGPKMCKKLHLKAVQGRPAANEKFLSTHAINPMTQPELSKIPILTLVESYQKGTAYDSQSALEKAIYQVCGSEMAPQLLANVSHFHEQGLDGISQHEKEEFVKQYSQWNCKVAKEVLDWLQGNTVVGREVFLEQ